MPHTLPGGDVSKTELCPGFEELPAAETSKSEESLGSDESSTLEETSMTEAYPGPQEPSDVEFSVPEAEVPSSYLPEPSLSPEATEALPQAGPFQLAALGLLPSLHDPFAEVEAKLARLSSAVAGAEALQAGAPRLSTQVAGAMLGVSRRNSAGGTQAAGCAPRSHRLGGSSGLVAGEALCRAPYIGREGGWR